jgi:hypothetical protein
MAVKVKQSTIDEIKKMGMTKALASAKTRTSPEWQEALKRMYGARRLSQAKGSAGRPGPGAGSAKTKGKVATYSRSTSSPVKDGGGTGYKGSPKSQQQARNRKVAGGLVGGAAALAAGSKASGRKNISAAQARAEALNKGNKAGNLTKKAVAERAKSRAAAARNVMPTVGSRVSAVASRASVPTAAAYLAYKGAQKAKKEADAAGRKVKATGSGRASSMAASIARNRKKGPKGPVRGK